MEGEKEEIKGDDVPDRAPSEIEANPDIENAANLDENVFKQNTDLFETQVEQEFQCINPQNKGGHIVYKCKGMDKDGVWEGERRYNEFYVLHACLEQRWPGIPIPTLPPKKAIGNKDVKFINERRFYLERFLKKLAPFDFIINSQEFKNFSRPQGDIEKLMKALPKITTTDIVDRHKTALVIEEHLYNPLMKDKLDRECKEFQHFARQILPVLKEMQKKIATYMQNKSQGIQDYKIMLNMLDKYEELNLANYVEGNESKMVFGNTQLKHESSETIKEQVSKLCDNLKNPYFNMYHWCKGEHFDIEAVFNAINLKDKMQMKIQQNEKKKRNTQSDLDNVTTGRKTVKTLFKTTNDAGQMVNKIETAEKEIESLGVMYDLITIYLGESIVPEFKQRKMKIYAKIVQQFNVMQINNAHQVASFWSNVLSNPNIKAAVEQNTEEAKE